MAARDQRHDGNAFTIDEGVTQSKRSNGGREGKQEKTSQLRVNSLPIIPTAASCKRSKRKTLAHRGRSSRRGEGACDGTCQGEAPARDGGIPGRLRRTRRGAEQLVRYPRSDLDDVP